MTLIAALKDKTGTYHVAADRLYSGPGDDISISLRPKLSLRSNSAGQFAIFGTAGLLNCGEVVLQCDLFEATNVLEGEAVYTWLYSQLVPELRARMDHRGLLVEKEGKKTAGGPLLIVADHQLYRMSSDFSLLKPQLPYFAIGTGDDIAHGIFWNATDGGKKLLTAGKTQHVLRRAHAAAATHKNSVGGPVDYCTSKGDKLKEMNA